MALLRSFVRGFREAFRGIAANSVLSLASVSTAALTLTMLAGFLVVAANVHHLATIVEGQFQVRVYLEDGLPEADLRQLEAYIAGIPGVVGQTYVSKEEALEQLRQYLRDDQFVLEAVEEANPLPASFEIEVLRPDLVERVAFELKGQPGIREVSYSAEVVRRLLDLTNFFRLAGLIVAVLLTGVTAFIIANTIRITVFARRDEIAIMKLVGATDWYIRWPFVLEGIVLGAAGGGVAALLAAGGYRWLFRFVTERVPFLPLVGPEPMLHNLTLVLLAIGALVGVVGSQISVRRLLEV